MYDDFLIGAFKNDEGGELAGKSYLIFGKETGWSIDTDLADADASFIGESDDDRSGMRLCGVGDVNDDDYDDILISAISGGKNAEHSGKTYLIFGKSTGWTKNTNLSTSDASFIGENAFDYSGEVGGKGDFNGDGFYDILIGAYYNDEGGDRSGQSYLIYGGSNNWNNNVNLSSSDVSFIGENATDFSGFSLSFTGDVNDDGYDDILIGAYGNDDGEIEAGKTYLIYGNSNYWSKDTNLSQSNASFIGENYGDLSGYWPVRS